MVSTRTTSTVHDDYEVSFSCRSRVRLPVFVYILPKVVFAFEFGFTTTMLPTLDVTLDNKLTYACHLAGVYLYCVSTPLK